MTALAEIESAIRQEGPVPSGYIRSVVVGESAARSLKACAALKSETCAGNIRGEEVALPPAIMGVPVVETTQFPGWALVEKPLPSFLGRFGK